MKNREKIFADSQELRPEQQKDDFQDQLIEVWKEMNPDILEANMVDQEEMRQNVELRETAVRDHEVLSALNEYGIDSESVREEEGRFIVSVADHFTKKRLPEGYAYKGGAARTLLLRSLGIDSTCIPRDLDVVRIWQEGQDDQQDENVAKEFMFEDYEMAIKNGKTDEVIEYIHNFDDYFSSRDFTLNEVLADDREIQVTKQGLLDTVRRIIRISDYELKQDMPLDKQLAKMIRLYSEAIVRWGDVKIEGVDDQIWEDYFIKPFWLALQLDKSFELGLNQAEQYMEELKKRNQIPDDISSAEEAAVYLVSLLRQGDTFYYRHAPSDQFMIEEEWMTEYDKSPQLRGHGRSRGDK